MALLSIPKTVANALNRIGTLSDESFRELISALENIPLRLRQEYIFDDSELNLTTISPDDLKSIRDAIFPIIASSGTLQSTLDNYVNSIADSLKEENQDSGHWTQSEEAFNQFKQRLDQLLNVKSLRLVAKAHSILIEHAHIFTSAQIVSDIRPIFGEENEDPPAAAVIVHMLNMSYRSGNNRKDFVVALDTKDIQLMLDVLERAKAKTQSLESIIQSTNMTYIPVV